MIFRDNSVIGVKNSWKFSRRFEHRIGQHHGSFPFLVYNTVAGTPRNCISLSCHFSHTNSIGYLSALTGQHRNTASHEDH